MRCSSCGKIIVEDSSFCNYCGFAFKKSKSETRNTEHSIIKYFFVTAIFLVTMMVIMFFTPLSSSGLQNLNYLLRNPFLVICVCIAILIVLFLFLRLRK